MKNIKKIFVLILCLFFALCFYGCGYKTLDLTYFNTNIYIAVKGGTIHQDTISSLLQGIEDTFSNTKETSDISKINKLKSNTQLKVDAKTQEILTISKNAYDFTGGRFNIAVYPLLKLYKLSSTNFDKNIISISLPDKTTILNTASLCDFNYFSLDNDLLTKSIDNAEIDVGGIAKGYAVDKIANIFNKDDITEGYINAGGSSLYVFSTKENLSIKHPRKDGNILSVNSRLIKNSPLSTSGDYMRYYTDINDSTKRYCHIIDTKTFLPIDSGFCSVTVIANGNIASDKKTASFTDALSTALCAMEKNEFISFVNTYLKEFSVFAVYNKNNQKQILSNKALNTDFTILDSDYSFLNI